MADSDEPKHTLELFLEYCGMDFRDLAAEQVNLKSVHDTLHRLETTAAKILHLTKVKFLMGILNLPQDKLYWSRLLRLPLIC